MTYAGRQRSFGTDTGYSIAAQPGGRHAAPHTSPTERRVGVRRCGPHRNERRGGAGVLRCTDLSCSCARLCGAAQSARDHDGSKSRPAVGQPNRMIEG
ncbi:hypothetical protein CD934_31080 [Streptomyces calvus]|uniref:Uncharacterized protein n=1 Tax=Streptomyces calvus TaxID=67282 RepID=A0A514JZ10_9ACTN|nr:hypothetical protein CD934_31080 [Streptomyces calvus]